MVFRLNGKGDEQRIVEVTANSQFDDPDIGGIMVYVRPWGDRWLLDQVLDAIAGSSSLEATFDLLKWQVMRSRDAGGRRRTALRPRRRALARSGGGRRSSARRRRERGRRRRCPVGREGAPRRASPVRRAGRPAPRRAARRSRKPRGHTWCWVWPVPGIDEPQACLVLWRRLDEDADHTCRVSLKRLVRLTELVLAAGEHGRRPTSASRPTTARSPAWPTGARFLAELRATGANPERGFRAGRGPLPRPRRLQAHQRRARPPQPATSSCRS